MDRQIQYEVSQAHTLVGKQMDKWMDTQADRQTDDYESNFNFDYCGNEINENKNSNDHDCEYEHEQNIIEMGIEVEKEGE